MKKSEKKVLGIVLGSGLVIFLVIFSLQFVTTAIYDDFSNKKEFRFTNYNPPHVIVRNNNPISMGNFNSLFFIQITMPPNSSVECYYDVSKNQECNTMKIDVGKIDSGESYFLPFYVYPQGAEFTITATAFLNFIKPIPVSSKTWNCQPNNEYYLCELFPNK